MNKAAVLHLKTSISRIEKELEENKRERSKLETILSAARFSLQLIESKPEADVDERLVVLKGFAANLTRFSYKQASEVLSCSLTTARKLVQKGVDWGWFVEVPSPDGSRSGKWFALKPVSPHEYDPSSIQSVAPRSFLRRIKDPNVRDCVRKALSQGWTAEPHKGHITLTPANGNTLRSITVPLKSYSQLEADTLANLFRAEGAKV